MDTTKLVNPPGFGDDDEVPEYHTFTAGPGLLLYTFMTRHGIKVVTRNVEDADCDPVDLRDMSDSDVVTLRRRLMELLTQTEDVMEDRQLLSRVTKKR